MDKTFQFLTFADNKLPSFKENKGKQIVNFGDKNDYPEKLLELYNRSPKHNAILTKKVHFIVGKETVIEGSAAPLVEQWNKYDTLKEFNFKTRLDKKLFGAFAVEVVYDRTGKPSYYHMQVSKVRTLDHSCYQYWPDGSKTKANDIIYYDAYDPNNLVKGEDGFYKKQILYVREYRADLAVYSLPDYIGAIQYIDIDTRISNFHLNNIATGFAAGTLVQMFKGEPTPEQAREAESMFKGKTAGDDNAGGILLQWNSPSETPAKIDPLTPNDLDKQFLMLNDHVQQEIFVGHGVTSPMLFGVRVEGQLGGRSELAEAYEIYYRDCIEREQVEMDKFIEGLIIDMGLSGTVHTEKAQPIGLDYVQLYEAGLVSKPVAQEELGLPVDDVPQLSETQKLTDAINSLSPLVANKVLNELSTNEVRGLAGLPPIEGGDNKSAPTDAAFSDQNPFGWDDKDLELFAEYGQPESDYEYLSFAFADLTKDESKIIALVNEQPTATTEQISKATELELPEVEKILKALEKKGKIKWTGNKVRITEIGKEAAMVLRWKYALAPEAKPLLGESRPFCKKMMELNRVYSREDIDILSERLGYDVWKRRGGWYTDPDTNIHKPQCRHIWKQVILKKKQ